MEIFWGSNEEKSIPAKTSLHCQMLFNRFLKTMNKTVLANRYLMKIVNTHFLGIYDLNLNFLSDAFVFMEPETQIFRSR